MSLIRPLLRWIDPVGYSEIRQERRRKREALPPGWEGDDFEMPPPPPSQAAAEARRICRVCGQGGGVDERFCPRCLAETLELVRRKR